MIRALCLIAALLSFAVTCVAADGVLVEDRVVNLPQDQNKWYVSVVGDAGQVARLSGWFETSDGLKKLKAQVKFCRVTTGTAVFAERYAANVSGLPTVRMQKADGTVVYEASGDGIPMTPESLYTAMAGTSAEAQGCRPILPWRREMENRPCPCPSPSPEPAPPLDPEPDPIDDGGEPEVAIPEKRNIAFIIGLIVMSTLAGSTAGGVVAWKRAYGQK